MNIILIGSSGHAKVIIDIVQKERQHTIVGLVDKDQPLEGEVNGVPVLGSDSDLPRLSKKFSFDHGILCVYDNFTRQQIRDKVVNLLPNFHFVTAIHPKACISKFVRIGAGTVVMGGVTINSNCQIGEHCVLNSNSSIDHDCVMDNFSSIGPGVNLGGNVTIGAVSYVGIGSAVSHNVTIGEHSVIGGLSFVNKDVGDRELGYLSPYRRVRSREPGERYL
jgi:sugar O-acyltransferase (sialic acid O-acetyltransferase NeuD family)